MQFVIDRFTWLRGEGTCRSFLLRREDGKKCCLGFYLLACGMTPEQIEHKESPSSVRNLPEEARWLIQSDQSDQSWASDDADDLMFVNDAMIGFKSKQREQRIARIFAKHGVDVKFVDKMDE